MDARTGGKEASAKDFWFSSLMMNSMKSRAVALFSEFTLMPLLYPPKVDTPTPSLPIIGCTLTLQAVASDHSALVYMYGQLIANAESPSVKVKLVSSSVAAVESREIVPSS